MLMLKRPSGLVAGAGDISSYLRDRITLGGRSGRTLGGCGIAGDCVLIGVGFCCFSSITERST